MKCGGPPPQRDAARACAPHGLGGIRRGMVCLWSVSGLSLVCLWSVSGLEYVSVSSGIGKMQNNAKKMQKNARKYCIYQKKAVTLQRIWE